jgi:hypothetical protein
MGGRGDCGGSAGAPTSRLEPADGSRAAVLAAACWHRKEWRDAAAMACHACGPAAAAPQRCRRHAPPQGARKVVGAPQRQVRQPRAAAAGVRPGYRPVLHEALHDLAGGAQAGARRWAQPARASRQPSASPRARRPAAASPRVHAQASGGSHAKLQGSPRAWQEPAPLPPPCGPPRLVQQPVAARRGHDSCAAGKRLPCGARGEGVTRGRGTPRSRPRRCRVALLALACGPAGAAYPSPT